MNIFIRSTSQLVNPLARQRMMGYGTAAGGDSTPGGATDVWMWEDGIGMLWETGYFIQTN